MGCVTYARLSRELPIRHGPLDSERNPERERGYGLTLDEFLV